MNWEKMDCPVCKIPLIVVERKKIEVDYCISCNGMWFDSDEIALFCEAFDLNFNIEELLNFDKTKTDEEIFDCPKCGKKMEKVCFHDTKEPIIDKCPDNHGLWFDKYDKGDKYESFAYYFSHC